MLLLMMRIKALLCKILLQNIWFWKVMTKA
ncbi:hypothetical protein Golax_022301 [Gossypium laxum]|uniref:Uncharacterized protein n=1 Tax=Gossypium laxum TaxID=34288 RepID=A0A7J9AP51_9ROSI|nr:hypothetical protein [Gossypium laxum]